MERNDVWLKSERARLMTWDRDQLIDWLQWADPNGIWSDEDMLSNDMDPMSVEEAVDQVMNFIEDNKPYQTPEEMMKASADANPTRYHPGTFDKFGF